MTDQVIIAAQGLYKAYSDNTVVRGIDFAVMQGQCVGLLGPNGAGKTTTIGMILGNSRITSGALSVFGLPVQGNELAIRQRSGVVVQTDDLDPDFTVEENLLVFASFYGMSKAAAHSVVPSLLEFVQLTDKAKAKVDQLSGGMKRRLSIARALINDPELVIMDEPTTGLDPQVRHLIWERLRRLKQQGKTLLLTTHYMEEAERLCDNIWVIDNGIIIAQGSPRELIAEHVESQVVEVHGGNSTLFDQVNQWQLARIENVGETLYCYCDQPQTLMDNLLAISGVNFYVRPSNLEDVFLRLTGRDLRD
ncbi:MAG: ATP-binding cassette domain-containing protein [Arenicella sp.]